MSYVVAEHGNNLPAVALVQLLLSRAGGSVTADGDFGRRTKDAVRSFQAVHRPLVVDGKVSVSTWPILVDGEAGFTVLDCIDVGDPDLYELEVGHARRHGGNPVVIGGMCNGVEQAVSMICGAAPAGSVALLRFHGHGNRGIAAVGAGDGSLGDDGNFARASSAQAFARLRPLFSRYGCIQFMHCSTGSGARGTNMLRAIANATGVPVTAAIRTQLGGGHTTFRYEGPTKTVVPNGGSIKSWATSLPFPAGSCRP